jgi:hypothetical protein
MEYMYTDRTSPYISPQLEVEKLLMSFLYTDRQRQLVVDVQSSEIYKRHFGSHAAGMPRGNIPRKRLVLDLQSRSITHLLISTFPESMRTKGDLELESLDSERGKQGKWRAQNTGTHGALWSTTIALVAGLSSLRIIPQLTIR